MSTRKIFAGPADQGHQSPLLGEGKALTSVAPGNLVEVTNAGVSANGQAATVFGKPTYVAKEIGSNYGATIDTAWQADDNLQYIKVRSGEFVWVTADAGIALDAPTALSASSLNVGNVKAAATDGTEEIQFNVVNDGFAPGSTVANNGDLILVEKL